MLPPWLEVKVSGAMRLHRSQSMQVVSTWNWPGTFPALGGARRVAVVVLDAFASALTLKPRREKTVLNGIVWDVYWTAGRLLNK